MTSEPTPPPRRATFAAAAVLSLTAVAVVLLLLATRPQPVEITILPPAPTATPLPTATPAPVTVYVTGAVAQPDTLRSLPAGSRVEDALAAAGGALPEADLSRVNLAARLRDGDQIHVPPVDAPDLPLPTASGGDIVNLNAATREELETLPGIGPVTAQAILDYRAAHGPFADLAALDNVEGIGPATLQALADRVVFE
jgi:competence protein ComEA